VLCSPEHFTNAREYIGKAAENYECGSSSHGAEAEVDSCDHEWQSRVDRWREIDLSHFCPWILGGSLEPQQYIEKMCEVVDKLKI
jgi:hypothetical protein